MTKDAFLSRLTRNQTGKIPPRPPLSRVPMPAPLTVTERTALFVTRATAALSTVHTCSSSEDVRKTLASIIGTSSYVDSGIGKPWDTLLQHTEGSRLDVAEAQHADIGLSLASIGVALTGSCALASNQHRGSMLLPPRHIIIVDSATIVDTLDDAYAWVAEQLRSGCPSAIAFHTGPSRSADIEQTMALGVHGPGTVDVILIAYADGL